MKKSLKTSQKIVVKVGSSVLTGGGTAIIAQNLRRIVGHIAHFVKEGRSIIVVTSGAIASGLSILGFTKRPAELAQLQAAAAVGQNILMQAYNAELEKSGFKGAQILLTREDFGDRTRYLNAINTINTLLKHKIIPIINENDAISVEEIKFGDNDTLSARVAVAVKADGLVIMTDIRGIFEIFDHKTGIREKHIKVIDLITPEVERVACGTDKGSCVGGMSTKVAAARIATSAGIPVAIVDGLTNVLRVDFKAKSVNDRVPDGTLFCANTKNSAKKHWLAFEAIAKGRLSVDDGAKTALIKNSKSLLAPGVVGVEGHFRAGDIIEVTGGNGEIFAKGKVNFSASELSAIKGRKAKDEVVHRDNLVIL